MTTKQNESMKTQHTPGPWSVSTYGTIIGKRNSESCGWDKSLREARSAIAKAKGKEK